ncbi:MAG TPA: 4-hydroxy-tetrahydrodipicolinate synthase [Solirubrobacterales bacterium]|jgi:4-hydroxy-tetrahydrodipicolinate synthase|nr:4-hydroxy-tetrahydrodipicolinate synthase [Solirubrobacterales bacterium]
MPEIKGVITAMVTPFAADESLDLDAARRLARYLVENGSHGLVVSGTTGEAPTLSDDEKLRLLDAVLDEVGDQATVICGTGSNDTRHSAGLTAKAHDVGAHAVLVVTPYYNKPNRSGLLAHFAAVAEAAQETPVVLYNIPSRTVINMPPDLLAELAAGHANIVAVKQANNEDLGPIEGLDVLAGNDEVFARTLEFGGPGGILVSAHVVGPRMRAVYEAAQEGDHDRAGEIDAELRPIYEAMTVTANPIPVKTALELLGVIEATLRLPMVPASADEREAVRTALERQGLLVAGGAG